MEDYKANSHRAKEEVHPTEIPEKKVTTPVATSAKKQKKSLAQKAIAIFVPEDIENVKEYVMSDVIIPMVKKSLMDILNIVLNGTTSSDTSDRPKASKFSYQKCYDTKTSRNNTTTRYRNGYDYDDIVVKTRTEAEAILSGMDEIMARYGIVSIFDFYELADVESTYADNKYGWTDIRSASVIPMGNGYTIKLPKAMPLD